MQRISICVLMFFGFLWTSCKSNSNKESTTYIHIDSFKFVANPALRETTLSHQITGVSVYYNNKPLGIFGLPATIPVDAAGASSLVLYPCVDQYGQSSDIAAYPFYEADTFAFAPQPGKIITHEGMTSYLSNVKINVISNFESGLTNFYLAEGNVPMTLVTAASPARDTLVFEGGGSGTIYLTHPGVDSSTDSTFSFVIPSGVAFIEFNYKSSLPFYVGLQTNSAGFFSSAPYYLAGFYLSGQWQKIYLAVNVYAAAYEGDSYNFYVKVALPAGIGSGRVSLDNLQLVTF